jgi:hypothetical protein
MVLVAGCTGQKGTAPATSSTAAPVPATPGSASTTSSGAVPSTTAGRPQVTPAPVAGHPRLFVRAADLPRLRSWATPANPIYAEGLERQVAAAKKAMDAGSVPGKDTGSTRYEDYPTELFAELFAFASLVEPDQAARDDAGRRARDLLMHVITAAAPGQGQPDEPFRSAEFATSDRSRWWGEAFGITVDWAYPYFSAEDKVLVRKVFLRWAAEQFTAYPLTELSGAVPLPDGPTNDPALLADPKSVRYSLNNYYIAHYRNLGLMALSLDAGDDPGGELHKYLRSATGTWMYVTDHAMRTSAEGGFSPEGFEYGPEALGRLADLLLALHTSGEDDPAKWGPQVVLGDNPFWQQTLLALLHSLPTGPVAPGPDEAGLGPIWQPAWFGDAQEYWVHELLPAIAPLALYAMDRGDQKTVDIVRWLVTEVPAGGRAQLTERIGSTNELFHTILAFLVLDPAASPAPDPRPGLPLTYAAAGLNRVLARTCWCSDARLFTSALSWSTIDHQRGDGGDIGFYRKGEWLTKQRTGYSNSYSDYHNTLTIQNSAAEQRDPDDPRFVILQTGSQWVLDSAGDPVGVTRSFGDGYVSTGGDITALYNSTHEGATDVAHASRSAVWIQPDDIVLYDRVESKADGRFARFWLQTPALARVDGNRAIVDTPGHQQLVSTSLLPAGAKLTAAPDDPKTEDAPARGEPMQFRLRVEPPSLARSQRFLTVVEGGDGGAAPHTPVLLQPTGSAFAGAAVAGTAVLFPADFGEVVDQVDVPLPDDVHRVLVTGLTPDAGYDISMGTGSGGRTFTLRPGTAVRADSGGVLSAAA